MGTPKVTCDHARLGEILNKDVARLSFQGEPCKRDAA